MCVYRNHCHKQCEMTIIGNTMKSITINVMKMTNTNKAITFTYIYIPKNSADASSTCSGGITQTDLP